MSNVRSHDPNPEEEVLVRQIHAACEARAARTGRFMTHAVLVFVDIKDSGEPYEDTTVLGTMGNNAEQAVDMLERGVYAVGKPDAVHTHVAGKVND